MKRVLIKIIFGIAIFSAVSVGAYAAPVEPGVDDGHTQFDYHEECNREGCDREEVEELWESFKHECFSEGCWYEEVLELSGGWVYDRQMLDAFRKRLGKKFSTPTYRTNPRPDPFDWVCRTFGSDGPFGCEVIITTPPIGY